MASLLFLAVLILWIYILHWFAKKTTNKLNVRRYRIYAKWFIFVVLFPLPIIDEIVGGWQFSQICKDNVVRVNRETANVRNVYLEQGNYEIPVSGTWVRVWKLTTRFLDASTNEVVLSFDQFRAEGGRLTPGFDSGHDPVTFKANCSPANVGKMKLFSDLGLTVVDSQINK